MITANNSINDSIEDAIKDNLKTIKRRFKKFQKDQFKKDYINEQENSYLRKKNKRDWYISQSLF